MPTNQQIAISDKTDEEILWSRRLEVANEYYRDWSDRFKCDDLELAYYGFQWEQVEDYDPYVVNLIFSTIDVKEPNLLFQDPAFNVRPKPNKTDYNAEEAYKLAKLNEDVLNYFAQKGIVDLGDEIGMAILDSWFRFGVAEVGYDADWLDNPNAGQPLLKSDLETIYGDDNEIVKQPKKLPAKERIYVKRIPAYAFRVGGFDSHKLERSSWCGYYEWHRTEDIKHNETLDLPDDFGSSGVSSDFLRLYKEELSGIIDDRIKRMAEGGDLTLIWKIWDMRSMEKIIYIDPIEHIARRTPFKRLPIKTIKWRNTLQGWYPLPPVFNWMSPQRDANEIREAERIHRRRFVRKYVGFKGAFGSEDERRKLENGGDGTIAWADSADTRNAVVPVENANLGVSHDRTFQLTQNDINLVSGTSNENRLQAGDQTATQSKIIAAQSTIRDSRDKLIVAKFLAEIGEEILLQAKEKLTRPFWVEIEKDNGEDDFGEIQETERLWAQLQSEDLGDQELQISVNVTAISPVVQEEEKRKFIEFVSILTNFPTLALSPTLVREVAQQVGYRNEKTLKVFQRMAKLNMAGQLVGLQNAGLDVSKLGNVEGEPNGNQFAQQAVANELPPDQEQITNQLTNQLQVQ